jgi:uncharacterized metal-binding protein (TIGR02443 family)
MVGHGRRFVAGAVCAACGIQDRIVIYRADGLDWRECVACAWRESRPEAASSRSDSRPAENPMRLIGFFHPDEKG